VDTRRAGGVGFVPLATEDDVDADPLKTVAFAASTASQPTIATRIANRIRPRRRALLMRGLSRQTYPGDEARSTRAGSVHAPGGTVGGDEFARRLDPRPPTDAGSQRARAARSAPARREPPGPAPRADAPGARPRRRRDRRLLDLTFHGGLDGSGAASGASRVEQSRSRRRRVQGSAAH